VTALALYRVAAAALEPLAPLVLRRRAARGKEDLARLPERLGRPSAPRPPGALAWLHGASVGESLSLLPLVGRLRRERPDLNLLVTSGTVTSAKLLAQRLPAGVIHQYAPIDAPAAARRFLAHWRPDLVVFVESELWPNLLLQAKARGARLALLGARLSEASAQGWARIPRAARALLGAFDLILTQDAVSRARIEALGGSVAGDLDLKQAGEPLACDGAELAALQAAVAGRRVLVAASTHPGEDEIVAGVLAALPAPAPLLVLVPRHPIRGADIAASLCGRGLTLAQRSAGEPLIEATQVYLADTLGELGLAFRLADVVVMGGSLTGGIGGHNPLEPARLGLPVVTGADTVNFRETYAGLIAAGAAFAAADAQALGAIVADLLADPGRARAAGLAAKAFAERGDGAMGAAWAALAPLLPPAIA
jgi:3-deoxy-D-manno-octulosonic-acid transferase